VPGLSYFWFLPRSLFWGIVAKDFSNMFWRGCGEFEKDTSLVGGGPFSDFSPSLSSRGMASGKSTLASLVSVCVGVSIGTLARGAL
jgi:hypothetical protein